MASFKSILDGIGHILGKIFSPGAVKLEASISDLVLPGFAPLINSAAAAVINAEAAAAAAGAQNGTGTQKLAYAIAQFGPDYDAWAAANNIPVLPTSKEAFLNGVVGILNQLPLPTTAIPAPALAPAPVSPEA